MSPTSHVTIIRHEFGVKIGDIPPSLHVNYLIIFKCLPQNYTVVKKKYYPPCRYVEWVREIFFIPGSSIVLVQKRKSTVHHKEVHCIYSSSSYEKSRHFDTNGQLQLRRACLLSLFVNGQRSTRSFVCQCILSPLTAALTFFWGIF